jgi:DNA-binding CsgD family transcriptional regulator
LHPRTQSAFRRALDPEPHDNDDIDSYESEWDRNAWPAPSESDDARREFLVLDDEHVTIARAAVEPLRRASTRETQTYLISLYPQPKDAEVSTQSLRSLYGLSPSEARVAAHVVTVKSVAELAGRLALSRNTVKAHLRQIFRKCEVSSFGQLTALVATGPGVRQTRRSPKLSA